VKWYVEANAEVRIKGARDGHEHIGVVGNAESVEWLWNHHFAAVAGDAIAFEAWPPKAPYSEFLSLLLVERLEMERADEKQDSTTTCWPCRGHQLVSFGIWKSWLRCARRRISIASSLPVHHSMFMEE
jgi:hypothetical protein